MTKDKAHNIFDIFSLTQIFNDIEALSTSYAEVIRFIPGTSKILDQAEKQTWDEETTVSALAKNYEQGETLSTAMNVATGLGFLVAGVASTTISPILFFPIYLLGTAQLILTYSYKREPNSIHLRRARTEFKKHFE